MMQQGGVASITKPNAYLVRKTKKQQQQQKLILQAAYLFLGLIKNLMTFSSFVLMVLWLLEFY